MLPYRMAQTRRALIRRALATPAAIAAPAAPAPARAPRLRSKPRIALSIDPARFAHLASPEAAAAMRRWSDARSDQEA